MDGNRVVIYSNGIADFQRCFEVASDSPERISLPVRQDHLADVLASFNVYGNVKLLSPPTFRPSNEMEGSISINPQQVLEDLATGLSGAKVRVERAGEAIEGTLVGLHQEEEATAGEPIHPQSLIVLTAAGLRRCLLREIQSLSFLDEEVQREIDKALHRNYQRIKPNSTFVEFVLSVSGDAPSTDKTPAIVQYTMPAAAWKISYRLRINSDQPTELQGFAIVDNNTDEDWTDFHVCVVTGEPITFSTDLAESKIPRREHVNLVSESALGVVEVEDMVMMGAAGEADDAGAYAAAPMMMQKNSRRAMGASASMRSAETTAAEVHEVGDFNFFESESTVSIPAKRSTVIPVFQVEVADCRSVLHYKHQNHATRPYRSIDFTNQTSFSLSRGVCTVFEETAYAGSCILPAVKPGESRLLPHALETGISVQRVQPRQQNQVTAVHLAAGFCHTSTRQRRNTEYHLKNSRNESYKLVLDHDHLLLQPELQAQLHSDDDQQAVSPTAELTDGVRYTLTLAPNSQATLKLSEQRVEQSKVELITHSQQHESEKIHWIEQHLIQTNGPLAHDPGLQACLRIYKSLEAERQKTADARTEIERQASRQDRLRKNIQSGGQDDLTSRWRAELDQAEQAIKQLEETQIPTHRTAEKDLRSELREALKSLSAEWSEEGKN